MKKVAILIEDLYNVHEAWYPFYRLREENFETFFVGPEKKEYKSKEGVLAHADLSIEEVDPDEFDAVIIPGGYAPDRLRRNEKILNFVRKMYESGKVVAAICHAGWVLVSSGILRGKRMTGFYAIKDDLKNAGAEYVDEEVVVDGNLVTSRVPQDLPVFCKKIIELLKSG